MVLGNQTRKIHYHVTTKNLLLKRCTTAASPSSSLKSQLVEEALINQRAKKEGEENDVMGNWKNDVLGNRKQDFVQ